MKSKILNSITIRISEAVEKLLLGKSFFTKKNTLLILRLDSIGDYILFRNFIKEIHKSEAFENFQISILGNIVWKDVAEIFDKEYVKKFIWIDKKKFDSKANWRYKLKLMLKIHLSGYEILIRPNDTKTKLTDYIIKHSGTQNIIDASSNSIFFLDELEKISMNGDSTMSKPYKESVFQFNRNKTFIENITGKKSNIKNLTMEVTKKNGSNEYIVIFPGAGNDFRKWSAENYSVVCRKIFTMKKIKILICGNISDQETAKKIIFNSGIKEIEDLTGKTSLPELIELIANAELLISNETCAVHIAASVKTNTICISNGNHFGRFNPYPKEMAEFISTIYPDEILKNIHNYSNLVKKFHISSDLDINTIKPDTVLNGAAKFFNNRFKEEKV